MHIKHKIIRLVVATTLGALLSSTAATPASADPTWISSPSLSSLTFVGVGNKSTATGATISSQATSFALTYKSSAVDAGKFIQVNFFDLSAGLELTLSAAPLSSSTACDQQVASGDRHSCMFKLDGAGSAAINIAVTGASATATFKYLVLSGPNITQSAAGLATFAVPVAKVKALEKTVKARAKGAGVLRFQLSDNGKVQPGLKVTVKVAGIKSHVSATQAVSDEKGIVWIYVANTTSRLGMTTVTVSIDGTNATASSKIKWGR